MGGPRWGCVGAGWGGAYTHHVIGHEGQQNLELVWVDVEVGFDSISGPDRADVKELETHRG